MDKNELLEKLNSESPSNGVKIECIQYFLQNNRVPILFYGETVFGMLDIKIKDGGNQASIDYAFAKVKEFYERPE